MPRETCEGTAMLVRMPDPLGLDAVTALQALRCLDCGAPLSLGGRILPGGWVALWCERGEGPEGRESLLSWHKEITTPWRFR